MTTREISIYGSPLLFRQLILNLLTNAIEAYQGTEQKDKTVLITLHADNANNELSVRDHGVGIPKDKLYKIFEPFYTTKPSDTGIGIGLSTVKSIVEQELGGSIKVQSGEYTTFTIRWPQNSSPTRHGEH
ncbi:MAG: HAMP domain-containing histidine kinase [Candidatus Nomurabacteria bacterium]|nr:MAG: HAMP domain-containing histidine kinase [Candidatus Nomurabacteria bacterium]